MKKLFLLTVFSVISFTPELYAQGKGQVPNEGEIAMKTGRPMVMKDGQWVQMKEDMTMKDGTKVTKDGTVLLKNGTKHKLSEGEYIGMDGQVKKEKVNADKTTELKMKKGVE